MTITDCKIDLLKYGVSFSPLNLFNNIDKNKYKIKFINKNPQVNQEMQVFDLSCDNNCLPAEILIEDNNKKSLTKLRFNESSPIKITLDNKTINLYKDNEKLPFKFSLVEEHSILNEIIPHSISKNNFKIGDFISIVGLNRITILFYDGCYNWLCGKNCHFCDLHPKRPTDIVARPTLNNLTKYKTVENWWAEQKEEFTNCVIYSLKRVLNNFIDKELYLFFMAGNLQNSTQIWNIALELLTSISQQINLKNYISYVNIAPHNNIENLSKLKNLGITNVQYNLEIANKDLFDRYCPGKIAYEDFVNKLIEATTVFKKGHVRSNFVLGLQDPTELINFAEEHAKHGIVVDYSVFQPKKGTRLSNHPTLPFEEVVDFSKKLAAIYLKNGFKPIFSSVSSRSSIMNEIYEELYDRI